MAVGMFGSQDIVIHVSENDFYPNHAIEDIEHPEGIEDKQDDHD